ncbi:MAG: redoxin domain-containing protein [Pseudomonadota bacterium]
MMEALIAAVALSWVVILALCVVVYAMVRQIGLLHDRIKPVGALSLGDAIQVGDEAPAFDAPSLTGSSVQIGGARPQDRATLLFFLSSTCPVCKELLPALKSIADHESDRLRLVFASDGNEADHRAFIAQYDLSAFPYILSADVGMAYRVSKLPYGVVIGAGGEVRSHGLVNSREHIDSLLEESEFEGVMA